MSQINWVQQAAMLARFYANDYKGQVSVAIPQDCWAAVQPADLQRLSDLGAPTCMLLHASCGWAHSMPEDVSRQVLALNDRYLQLEMSLAEFCAHEVFSQRGVFNIILAYLHISNQAIREAALQLRSQAHKRRKFARAAHSS